MSTDSVLSVLEREDQQRAEPIKPTWLAGSQMEDGSRVPINAHHHTSFFEGTEQTAIMAKSLKMADPSQELSTLPDRKSIDEGHVSNVVVLELPPLLRDLSPEELDACEKRLVRKVDLRLLPALILIYIMNYLDRRLARNAIGAARLGGLEDDLGLKGNEYQTCVSILFVGYILMQVPSNMFLNKIGKPSMYLTACMAVWGVLCACSGAAQNFGGLVATRFFLGFVEAAFYPGA
ncbi:hypothetical protein VTK73DRAFT_7270 [Phialemonium thermophilum]|uniref:Major facilitator superfamily (MFS) profile domain-containing protein n=1 Tax=Phialemonium thermophilum TaxID=223376 RepID=A0ABR3WFF0_9PEZI